MNLKVGQVLYVVLNKQTAVYPMQVIEEITKKTLEGVVVDYILRGGTDPKSAIRLGDVDGEVFETADKAKRVLTDRVVETIEKRVEAAILKAKEWYPTSFEVSVTTPPTLRARKVNQQDDVSTEEDRALVDLGGGIKGRLLLPDGFGE